MTTKARKNMCNINELFKIGVSSKARYEITQFIKHQNYDKAGLKDKLRCNLAFQFIDFKWDAHNQTRILYLVVSKLLQLFYDTST